MKKLPAPLFVALSLMAFPILQAQAADSPLLRCRAITDNTARLACYDALVPSEVATLAGSAAAGSATASGAAGATAATGSASGGSSSTLATAAAKIADTFGLSSMGKSTEPDSIESFIPGAFDGWRANMRITLANGQVWRIIDDSDAFVSGDNLKIKVVKGILGNFIMEFEGSNRTAGVKRVK